MRELLYQSGTAFSTVYFFVLQLLGASLAETRYETLNDYAVLVVTMLIEEKAFSVLSLYGFVPLLLGGVGLTAFYAALSHSKMGEELFLNGLVRMGLSIADKNHPSAPIIFGLDDTTIKKFGSHFFGVSVLFDHSSHEKNKYINGHCFVACCLKVPVPGLHGTWHYLCIPLGYMLWVPKSGVSKLDIAEQIINNVMNLVGSERQVIILCDSWYTKSKLMHLTTQYHNLGLIGNARSDSACKEFDPPTVDAHKRGRKPKHGKKLTVDDYSLTDDKLNDFHVGVEKVACNMLKDVPVWAYVSSPTLTSSRKSKRLFFSTINPLQLAKLLEGYESIPSTFNHGDWELYSPMLLYEERWDIEVTFENQKTFWSLTEYKVRNEHSLSTLVNLINLAYAVTVLLPYCISEYAPYKNHSPQEIRKEVSQKLQKDIDIAKIIMECEDASCKNAENNPLYTELYETLHKRFEGASSHNQSTFHEPNPGTAADRNGANQYYDADYWRSRGQRRWSYST